MTPQHVGSNKANDKKLAYNACMQGWWLAVKLATAKHVDRQQRFALAIRACPATCIYRWRPLLQTFVFAHAPC